MNFGVTVAGSTSDPGPWAYQFNNPTSITLDPFGFMYILDFSNSRIQRWSPGASFGITVVSASMSSPIGLRFDRAGNLVVADTSFHRVLSFGMTCRTFLLDFLTNLYILFPFFIINSSNHYNNISTTK